MEIKSSDLILNEDGSIYHLGLSPEDIADNVILVGDPNRVDLIARYLESIELRKQNREFKSVTGIYQNKRLTIISSGIGTDNIDIVINELDALKNIDLTSRKIKDPVQSLNIIRIGTSGAIQEDIPSGSFVITEKSIGFDNLMHFYRSDQTADNKKIEEQLKVHLNWDRSLSYPYVTNASESLLKKFHNSEFVRGMTISAPGFYGPQGRKLRISLADERLNNKIQNFQFDKLRITNYEMESSAIYSLSRILGHQAIAVCAIIANRVRGDHITDYNPLMEDLVKKVFDNL